MAVHRRAGAALIPILVMAMALQASGSQAATSSRAVVTVSKLAQWDFAPVGGHSGATDSFDLTVRLPGDPSTLYAPDVRTGSAYAGVLTITLRWAGGSSDDTLGLSATDSKKHPVGDDTLALSNAGGDVNVFMLQMPR